MIFRDITQSDRPAFLEMAENFYGSGAVFYNIDKKNFENTFALSLSGSPFLRVIVFEDAAGIIGYALLCFTYSNEAGGNVVLIEEIYIKEQFRGSGTGKKFFDFLFKEYPNSKRFRLEVTKENPRAAELYRSLGFSNLPYVQMVKDL